MKAASIVSTQELLVIDDDYDRSRAFDGFSRYGAYLAMRLPFVAQGDADILTDPVRWAAFAWATATPPIMTPGYLAWNDPIEDSQLGWGDGRLSAEMVVRTELPCRLAGWRTWEHDRYGALTEPGYADRFALSRISSRALLDLPLPEAPGTRGAHPQLVDAAKAAVGVATAAVERTLALVLVALSETCTCRLVDGRQP